MSRSRDDFDPDADTFSRMQPRERGRFGDREHAPRGRVTGASDLHDFTLRLKQEKPLAIAVTQEDGPQAKWIWLPKSQIEFVPASSGLVVVTMPERIAKEKGLL